MTHPCQLSPPLAPRTPHASQPTPNRRPHALPLAGFTLVESVIAIGLFAFVIVGIVGLFGSALERQRQASFETRAVMVSQQIIARIRAADSIRNIALTRGTDEDDPAKEKLFHTADFTVENQLASFYKQDGTEISGLTPANTYTEQTYSPFSAYPAELAPGDIVGRTRTTLTANGTGNPNLYRVTIEVSEPANLPIAARRYTNTFTTFATLPN
jgi:type II secretory pathway pseudopilin PulG